jgi:hypothetical protein
VGGCPFFSIYSFSLGFSTTVIVLTLVFDHFILNNDIKKSRNSANVITLAPSNKPIIPPAAAKKLI